MRHTPIGRLSFGHFKMLFFALASVFLLPEGCRGQENKSNHTSEKNQSMIPLQEQKSIPLYCTIRSVEIKEKPYEGYTFYDSTGKPYLTKNIRYFKNYSLLHDELAGSVNLLKKTGDAYDNSDTLNSVLTYDLNNLPAKQKAKWPIEMRKKQEATSANMIKIFPVYTEIMGNQRQYLMTKSLTNLIKNDTSVWTETVVTIHNCKNQIEQQVRFDEQIGKAAVSDDATYLIAEIEEVFYGYEWYREFKRLLLYNFKTKSKYYFQVPLSDPLIDYLMFNDGVFQVGINRDTPLNSIFMMVIDPIQRKVYQKQCNYKEYQYPMSMKTPDGTSIDLGTFKSAAY